MQESQQENQEINRFAYGANVHAPNPSFKATEMAETTEMLKKQIEMYGPKINVPSPHALKKMEVTISYTSYDYGTFSWIARDEEGTVLDREWISNNLKE